ncbi:MAG: DUF883 family protein [Methanocalculus sp. MSAO_Arc1]|uniref:DUF883 family protein n=1 Tax=Methanocalculus TaxID=71151 RepID=UPI000FF2A174|nr:MULTISPECIES: hypothetical protein [unclassified Methanocalculus]MCP1661539.1 ElaB/YqjD/DUF883 family membrane-anchored ribosome-binding protein [Methanocalculus sp. AMF5]RQD81020.1 MAG: DUF883 family protein [Methanocalculus sp. MSAO_Arc1]
MTTEKETEAGVPDIKELKADAAAAFEEAAKKLKNTRSKLDGEELEALVLDLEDKLRSLAPEAIPTRSELEQTARKVVQDAEQTIQTVAEKEAKVMKERVQTVESFVSDHPVASIAIAAGTGFLVGLIAAKLR